MGGNAANVIVVGAGPAGAMTAYHLARRGIRVLLLEKELLPRYKACGGGISGRTQALLPSSIVSVMEVRVQGLHLSYGSRHRLTVDARRPFAALVMRDRFDAFLVEQAVAAGAELREGTAVRHVALSEHQVQVEANGETLVAQVVVGADGVNSKVGHSLGLLRRAPRYVALEAEVAVAQEVQERWQGRAGIDFGYHRWGYGWVFPKEGRLSVGIAVDPTQATSLKGALRCYLSRLDLTGASVERITGHLIRFRPPGAALSEGRALLVGDAAGMADQFTAEGIYYGIRSAELAAATIATALERGDGCLSAYDRAVEAWIMPELEAARFLSRLFFGVLRRSPGLTFQGLRFVPDYCRVLFAVQAGETSYTQVVRSFPLPFLMRLFRERAAS